VIWDHKAAGSNPAILIMAYLIKDRSNNKFLSGFLEHKPRWGLAQHSAKRISSKEECELICMGLEHKYNVKAEICDQRYLPRKT
jgi:hypothetical protein